MLAEAVIVAAGFSLSAVLGMIFPAYGCGACIGLSFLVLSRALRTSPVDRLR